MTEQEWLTCADPREMIRWHYPSMRTRKQNLFDIHYCRHYYVMVAGIDLEPMLFESWERYAEGIASIEELEWKPHSLFTKLQSDSSDNFWEEWDKQRRSEAFIRYYCWLSDLLRDIVGNPFQPVVFDPNWLTTTIVAIARGIYESRDFSPMPLLADALQDAGCENEEILSHCRSARNFSPMPLSPKVKIQDANEDFLNGSRFAGPHVRGCWVVDLILGKH
jgi:hypothetical protein